MKKSILILPIALLTTISLLSFNKSGNDQEVVKYDTISKMNSLEQEVGAFIKSTVITNKSFKKECSVDDCVKRDAVSIFETKIVSAIESPELDLNRIVSTYK
ncbi:hypothetical protein [Chryseobacterium oryctis]|uniref:UrcA family protein n=1 Tax=Chryseobacterium oryctis TaxID=2952618 RepID=A0ABT3HPD5_9FLAO|nr:hypothetical protein [Chryseobacterium oryctis]MCW3161649.1 hypothetical protein [Chryseobacterium oryctis]